MVLDHQIAARSQRSLRSCSARASASGGDHAANSRSNLGSVSGLGAVGLISEFGWLLPTETSVLQAAPAISRCGFIRDVNSAAPDSDALPQARVLHARSCERVAFEREDGTLDETTLAELFPLPRDRNLFYWFDFGDDWIFSISRTRTAPQVANGNKEPPRLVDTRGHTPVQYPSLESETVRGPNASVRPSSPGLSPC